MIKRNSKEMWREVVCPASYLQYLYRILSTYLVDFGSAHTPRDWRNIICGPQFPSSQMASFLKDTCRNDTFAARPGVRLCSPRINMWETTHINYFLRPSTNQFQFIKSELDSNHVWIISGGEHTQRPEGEDRSSHEWRIPILTEARTHLNRNTRTRVSNIGNKYYLLC